VTKKKEGHHACSGQIRIRGRRGWGSHWDPCQKRGTKKSTDGKWYCGTHHPESVEARRKKSEAAYDRSHKLMMLRHRIEGASEKALASIQRWLKLERSETDPVPPNVRRLFEKVDSLTDELRELEDS